jgi:hypothetical protein
MDKVRGYFTVERNIIGASLPEMEAKLGFRPGRLLYGARILLLQRQPVVGEFVFAGSTRYSNAKGLVGLEQRKNVAVPTAWLGQRLVKVVPKLRDTGYERYPGAEGDDAVEQWELLVFLPAKEICVLEHPMRYWRRR